MERTLVLALVSASLFGWHNVVVMGTVITGTGNIAINGDDKDVIPLKVKGIASQAGDYLSVVTSASGNLFKVSEAGLVTNDGNCEATTVDGDALTGTSLTSTGTIDAATLKGDRMQVRVTTANLVPLTLKHAASHSSNYITIQNSAKNNVFVLNKDGLLTIADDLQCTDVTTTSYDVTGTVTCEDFDGDHVMLTSDEAVNVPLEVQHTGTPPTSNYITIRESGDADRFKLTSAGNAVSSGTLTASSFDGSFAWSSINGKPSTRSGYGINDGMTNAQGTKATNAWQTINYNQIASRPNTLSGYGINSFMSSTQGNYANANNYLTHENLSRNKFVGFFNNGGNLAQRQVQNNQGFTNSQIASNQYVNWAQGGYYWMYMNALNANNA